ncbi:MAG TPA: hypothetical protein VJA27_00315 [Patescibacteria group bacterium]|nr:hypothetical protein [Patescibacteria group bacterium]
MSLLKQKISQITPNRALYALVLAVFLTHLVYPATLVNAKNGPRLRVKDRLNQFEEVLKQSAESRMFNPPVEKKTVPKADKVVKAVITAYSSTPDQTDDTPFIAASGKRVHDGMIAANWLPFGTEVKIPALYGDKIFTVGDRMNKRYGYGRMDIWMDAPKKEVRQFGVKRVEVEVYYVKKAPKKIVKK